MSKARVAIIGLGRIGASLERDPLRDKPCTHLGAWLSHPDRCELVGVCDTDGAATVRAGLVLEDYHLPRDEVQDLLYTDYQKMLTEAKADIVSIATPDNTHKEIARNAVRYQNVKLVFLEKPMAPTVEECDSILSAAREFNVKLAINHTRRWSPVWQHAAKLCTEEQPEVMVGTFGGDLLREGSHMADLFNWFNAKEQLVNHASGLNYLTFEVDLLWRERRIRISDNGRESTMYQAYPSLYYDDSIRELRETCVAHRNLWPGTDMFLAAEQLASAALERVNSPMDPFCDGVQGRRAVEKVLTWK